MDFERHQNDLRVQRKANRTLGAIVALLSLCQLLSLGVIAGMVGSERTIIVPPNIDKTFWVTRDKASTEYLEQMAGFMTWLVLDVSPSTIDWKRNVLLNYVAPDRHAAMKTQMDLEADRLRSNNASTSFLIQQLTPRRQPLLRRFLQAGQGDLGADMTGVLRQHRLEFLASIGRAQAQQGLAE